MSRDRCANGAAIKAIRKKDRKTAADVARYAGIETQSLYNIEDGQRNASREKLERIADILGVPSRPSPAGAHTMPPVMSPRRPRVAAMK